MKIRNKSTLQGPVSILYFFIDCLSAVRICVRVYRRRQQRKITEGYCMSHQRSYENPPLLTIPSITVLASSCPKAQLHIYQTKIKDKQSIYFNTKNEIRYAFYCSSHCC